MKLKIHTEFYIVLATACFLLDCRWIIGWLLAAFVHEAGHYIALRICAVEVFGIEVGPWGAYMDTGSISNGEELICALAGPASGLACLLFARAFPQMAVCAFVQSVLNLLPVYPMDGGRALRCILALILPRSHIRIQEAVDLLMRTLLLIGGAYCTVILKLGYIPAVMSLLIVLKGKTCKPSGQ